MAKALNEPLPGIDPDFAVTQLSHTTEMFLKTYADWISGVKGKKQVNLRNNI